MPSIIQILRSRSFSKYNPNIETAGSIEETRVTKYFVPVPVIAYSTSPVPLIGVCIHSQFPRAAYRRVQENGLGSSNKMPSAYSCLPTNVVMIPCDTSVCKAGCGSILLIWGAFHSDKIIQSQLRLPSGSFYAPLKRSSFAGGGTPKPAMQKVQVRLSRWTKRGDLRDL